jgi:hypothetical protein
VPQRTGPVPKENVVHSSNHAAVAKMMDQHIPLNQGGKSHQHSQQLKVFVVHGDPGLKRQLDQLNPSFAQTRTFQFIHARQRCCEQLIEMRLNRRYGRRYALVSKKGS